MGTSEQDVFIQHQPMSHSFHFVLRIFCWCSLPIFLVLYSFLYNFHIKISCRKFPSQLLVFYTFMYSFSVFVFIYVAISLWAFYHYHLSIIVTKSLTLRQSYTSIISDFLSELLFYIKYLKYFKLRVCIGCELRT